MTTKSDLHCRIPAVINSWPSDRSLALAISTLLRNEASSALFVAWLINCFQDCGNLTYLESISLLIGLINPARSERVPSLIDVSKYLSNKTSTREYPFPNFPFTMAKKTSARSPKLLVFSGLPMAWMRASASIRRQVGDWLLSRFVTISAVVFSMRMSWMSALFLADRSCRFVFARESGTGESSCLGIFFH